MFILDKFVVYCIRSSALSVINLASVYVNVVYFDRYFVYISSSFIIIIIIILCLEARNMIVTAIIKMQ